MALLPEMKERKRGNLSASVKKVNMNGYLREYSNMRY
jgi:hypothetical protein